MSQISYRWISGPECTDEEWAALDAIVAAQGWMVWNKETTMVRVAEADGEIVAFYPVQLIPHAEPLYVKEEFRGNGVANHLADDVVEWLEQIEARGWLAIADNPIAAKMCVARGWSRVEHPVYMVVREHVRTN